MSTEPVGLSWALEQIKKNLAPDEDQVCDACDGERFIAVGNPDIGEEEEWVQCRKCEGTGKGK